MTDFTKLKHLSLGQLLSICITCTNLTVTKLSELNVRLPLTLNLLTYLTLTLISYYKLLRTQTHRSLILWLKQNLWFGFVLGVIDVEANFLVIKGFSYTSLLSAMLIGAWSTPMVVILSYFLLGKRYRVNHYIGILLALIGLGVLIFSDYNLQENWWESDTIYGDILCLSGASLYALSNTIQEKFIQTWSPSEYLFILGLFGTLISFSQWYFIELNSVLNTQFTTLSLSLILLCTLGLVLFYSLTPTLITNTSATFFNISLLTSDFWSLLVGLILFDLKVPDVYPISFILVIYGLYLFNITKSKADRTSWYNWPEVNGSSENLAGFGGSINDREGYEAIP